MKLLTYGRVWLSSFGNSFSQYVKNLAMMNVMAMEKGKERWGMIADDIWDMILGKAGRLPGKLAPEIIEKAEREGRKFLPHG